MTEKTENEKEIYYYKGIDTSNFFIKWLNLIMGFLACIGLGSLLAIIVGVILSFLMKIQTWIFLIIWIPSSLYLFYRMLKGERKSKPSYKIYNDRIEFINEKYISEKDVIDLEEIDQVRYEDDFGKSYSSSVASQSWIYCYFKNGYKSRSIRIQKDRIKLDIKRGQERENKVIQILQFFQKEKKQVYISTKSEKIKSALNLKNWTDPGIHPSIKI